MHKIDNFLVESIDGVTTKIQRKGWLPLNTIIMATEVTFWSPFFLRVNYLHMGVWDTLQLIITTVGFSLAYKTWKFRAGYWENYRKTLALNAYVQRYRNIPFMRWSVTAFFIPLLILECFAAQIPDVVGDIALILLYWLQCCRYIGPGEFERERKSQLQGLPEVG